MYNNIIFIKEKEYDVFVPPTLSFKLARKFECRKRLNHEKSLDMYGTCPLRERSLSYK